MALEAAGDPTSESSMRYRVAELRGAALRKLVKREGGESRFD